jgi:hypothetical protein
MKLRTFSLLPALAFVLGACQGSPGGGPPAPQEDTELKEALAALTPHVRYVPEADRELLWQATLGYIQESPFPVDFVDEEQRHVETKTVERREDGLPHRTRITAQVAPDPEADRNARLGVIAMLIEPVYDLQGATSGRPLYSGWRLEGNNRALEEFIADQILRRYLLLRQGRDPAEVPPDEPIPGWSPMSPALREESQASPRSRRPQR